MSKTGTVKSWRGAYGFAQVEDGPLVWIHTDEIDGGKLRVGLKVNFDVEEVEGHGDRVKGTNVSGEAVLAKGQKLSDEEMEQERERLRKLRDEKKETLQAEFAPVWDSVKDLAKNQKTYLVKQLVKDLDLKMKKPVAKEERRADPTQRNGTTYTKAEFVAFYGKKDAERMWKAAGNTGKKGRKGGRRERK